MDDLTLTTPDSELPRELLQRFDIPGPRYTSYPTADRFVEAFDEAAYRQALDDHFVEPMHIHSGLSTCSGEFDAICVTAAIWIGLNLADNNFGAILFTFKDDDVEYKDCLRQHRSPWNADRCARYDGWRLINNAFFSKHAE